MSSFNLRTHFEAEVDARLAELKTILASAEKQRLIKQAVVDYSRHRPNTKVNDITGNGTFSYTINTTNFPSFQDGFSRIFEIEYPYDSDDAESPIVEGANWKVYQSTSAKVLRFLNAEPSASETIRVHYTIPWTFASDNDLDDFPDDDFYAVCDRAAAHCLRAIANKLTATGDSTFGADAVNYRTKAQEARTGAKDYDAAFKAHLGIRDDGEVSAAAVIAQDVDLELSMGGDFVTHPAWNR